MTQLSFTKQFYGASKLSQLPLSPYDLYVDTATAIHTLGQRCSAHIYYLKLWEVKIVRRLC